MFRKIIKQLTDFNYFKEFNDLFKENIKNSADFGKDSNDDGELESDEDEDDSSEDDDDF